MNVRQERELEIANKTPRTDEGLTAEGLDDLHKAREILADYSSAIRRALGGLGRQDSFEDMQAALTTLINSPLRERG